MVCGLFPQVGRVGEGVACTLDKAGFTRLGDVLPATERGRKAAAGRAAGNVDIGIGPGLAVRVRTSVTAAGQAFPRLGGCAGDVPEAPADVAGVEGPAETETSRLFGLAEVQLGRIFATAGESRSGQGQSSGGRQRKELFHDVSSPV